MSQFSEYAGWAGTIMGIVALFPRVLAVMTKRKEMSLHGEISRFESILKAQDGMLEDCRENCDSLEQELAKERGIRVEEREHFLDQLALLHREVYECRGIMHRNGWTDPRKSQRGGQAS